MPYPQPSFYVFPCVPELDKRFEQRTLTIPRRTEKLLLSATNWTEEGDLPIDEEVSTFYETDINGEHFRRQLRIEQGPESCHYHQNSGKHYYVILNLHQDVL